MYEISLRPITNLACIISLIGMFDILDLQIVPLQGYSRIHGYLLLAGTEQRQSAFPNNDKRTCKLSCFF